MGTATDAQRARSSAGMSDADASRLGRTTDGRLVERPLSPHLQIYKPQISTGISIFHRLSGIALSAGALLLVCWLVAAANGDDAYAALSGFLRSWLGVLLLFGWTLSLWFHFCAGLRHLAWDAGYGFDLPTMHLTGKAVLVATPILTVLTWFIAIIVW
jgi:succinate dehydrogenase / fumarate reductase, cytochrome b subunit